VLAELASRDVDVVALVRGPHPSIQESDRLAVVPMELEAMENPVARMGQPDVLIHLAWGGLPNFRANFHLESELPRQQAFLESCAGSGLGRLVVTGTCLEYGMQEGCLEEVDGCMPSTAYALAKDALRVHLQKLEDAGGPD
jgi:dTDP-6-deoxy-L-talose 4-dehydrogenase (NAD+)